MRKILLYFILILSSLIVIYSLFNIFSWVMDNNKTDRLIESLKELSNTDIEFSDYTLVNPPKDKNDIYYKYIDTNFNQVDFNSLLKENSDTVGWIKIEGTNIDYPIVRSTDNEFYLNHSFDKSYNKVGWIFLDFRNSLENLSLNTVIYGHNRKDNNMFGSLENVLKEMWYEDYNPVIKLSTPKENSIWQIVSVYEIKKESYYMTTYFKNNEKYQEFLDTIINRSKFNFNTHIDTNDVILTLSTCKDMYGNRIVVHSKLIKKGTYSN